MGYGNTKSCCEKQDKLDLLYKKLLILEETSNHSFTLKVINLEKESMTKSSKINLTYNLAPSLNGISQINIDNTLYLIGTNPDYIQEKKDFISSTMFSITIIEDNIKSRILPNSTYPHIFPSLAYFETSIYTYLIVIGGKNQKHCEIYNISNKHWIKLPSLNKERYKCSVLTDENNSFIYLFGGFNKEENKNSNSILRLKIENILKVDEFYIKNRKDLDDFIFNWEAINVHEGELLERNSSVAVQWDANSIFICGGKDNNGVFTNYIAHYDVNQGQVKKYDGEMKHKGFFDFQGKIRIKGFYGYEFCVFDNESNVIFIIKDYNGNIEFKYFI